MQTFEDHVGINVAHRTVRDVAGTRPARDELLLEPTTFDAGPNSGLDELGQDLAVLQHSLHLSTKCGLDPEGREVQAATMRDALEHLALEP